MGTAPPEPNSAPPAEGLQPRFSAANNPAGACGDYAACVGDMRGNPNNPNAENWFNVESNGAIIIGNTVPTVSTSSAQTLVLTSWTSNTRMSRIEERGLIDRDRPRENRRVVRIGVTAAGLTINSLTPSQNGSPDAYFVADIYSSLTGNTGPVDASVPNLNTQTSVPEPNSLAVFGSALLGFGVIRRRRKRGMQASE